MLRVASIATIVFALVAVLLSGHSSEAASVEIASDGVNQSRTLHEIVKSQRRYVLFNSRQLSGECLDVCVPTPRTDPPVPPRTEPPVDSSTIEPTREPSAAPSSSPTAAPSKSPTKSPSDAPSKSPTKSPSDAPSTSPTLVPTGTICKKQKEINVCIAIDNSGSVCSVGNPRQCTSGCGYKDPFDKDSKCNAGTKDYDGDIGPKSCCGNYQTVQDFAIDYINSLTHERGTVSVLKFANKAEIIADPGSKEDAIDAIKSKKYSGGYTNTEDAITRCTDEVKDLANPVVILITDGTPTACTTNDNGGWADQWDSGCGENSCGLCRHGAPKHAARKQADYADDQGVTLVPVVISSVSTRTEYLMSLARCKGDDDDCGFGQLHVDEIDDMPKVLEDLVKKTGCEEE